MSQKRNGQGRRGTGPTVVACVLLAPIAARADRLTQHWRETAKVIERTKFSAAKATEVAEAHSKGKAVSIHSVNLKAGLGMWIHCFADDKCMIVRVNPKTGGVDDMTTGVAADLSCRTAADAVKLMDAGKVNMSKTIEAAETHSKGKVVATKTEVTDGVLIFVLVCAVGDKAVLVTVDGTGKVTKMEDLVETAPKGG